ATPRGVRGARAAPATAPATARGEPGAPPPAAGKAVTRPPRGAAPRERNCSVGRTIDVIGDGWSFMVLRECYFGVTRFDQFQAVLGVPRTTLAHRLRRLTELGVLRPWQYSDRPVRHEYRLTKAGVDLYPVMLALMAFGDRWLSARKGKPLQLVHTLCGRPCSAVMACSHCREPILPHRVSYRDGPGAGTGPVPVGRTSRRSADPTALERRRPSSVARALRIIGDRWSFMIIREAFFRVRRFDDLQTRLGIAPNILADRLNRIVDDGVFERVRYQRSPERFEYRLTAMGKDLFGPLIAMLRWGDTWLARGRPPLILTHLDCGHDFDPTVLCSECREPLVATQMRYLMHYRDPTSASG
ncbi:MAG: winged helix-turn-helix transcriptional regulator, partial [Burkholderiales bacterium]